MPKINQIKTQAKNNSVARYINSSDDTQKKKDAKTILAMMKKVTGEKAVMWGESIVGFGTYHYKYDSGREGDFLRTGFSVRKTALTIYIMLGFEKYNLLMKKLGKYKTGKSCLYIKKLEDVDVKVLEELVKKGFEDMKKVYPE